MMPECTISSHNQMGWHIPLKILSVLHPLCHGESTSFQEQIILAQNVLDSYLACFQKI